METIKRQIEALGTAGTADELNNAYNQLALAIDSFDFDGVTTRDEMERTLNHIANYNLVRIANLAFEAYEKSGRTDQRQLLEIGLCRDSIKPHEDNQDEIDLLDGLCVELEIR